MASTSYQKIEASGLQVRSDALFLVNGETGETTSITDFIKQVVSGGVPLGADQLFTALWTHYVTTWDYDPQFALTLRSFLRDATQALVSDGCEVTRRAR